MCEFCGNDKDIIFPFQLNKCQRCEGEPSLLVAGLGGSRAPSPRPSFPLTWKDWKIPKPRRLARALYQDRREGEGGEGGEEDLERDVGQGAKCGEERGGRAEERQERGAIFQAFTPGKLVKAFSRSKGNEEEQEMMAGTESEREEETKCDKAGEEGGNGKQERAKSKEKEDGHAKREKVNLLKVLHIDRLKKSISKGDRGDSGSETCSSLESLDEVGQEKKGRWKVSGLLSLAKGFTKRETEDEGETEVKEEDSEKRYLEKVTGTEEEGKASWEAEGNDEISVKGQTEAAETAKPGAENVEKFTLVKLLKPHQLSAVFSRGRSGGEEDRSGESDGKREVDTEEEGQQEPTIITQTNWRGRKTRKARRLTRGRKIRERTENQSQTEGGESEEIDDVDYYTERGGGQE